MTNAHATQNEM